MVGTRHPHLCYAVLTCSIPSSSVRFYRNLPYPSLSLDSPEYEAAVQLCMTDPSVCFPPPDSLSINPLPHEIPHNSHTSANGSSSSSSSSNGISSSKELPDLYRVAFDSNLGWFLPIPEVHTMTVLVFANPLNQYTHSHLVMHSFSLM